MPAAAAPHCSGRRRRRGVRQKLLAWLGPLLFSAPAVAEPAAAEPATAQQIAPQPQWPALQTLLNLPGWMELDLGLTADPLLGNAPGIGVAGSWMQQLVLDASFSTGLARERVRWREVDHWSVDLALSLYSGNANLNQALGTAFALQNTAYPVGLWLTEAAIERRSAGDAFAVKAGVLGLNPGFVQAPVLNSYIHTALNNTLNLSSSMLPIAPLAAPAVVGHLRLGSGSELRIGQFWLRPMTGIAGIFGVNPQQPVVNGSLQIVQWSLHDLPGAAVLERPLLHRRQAVARLLPPPLLQLGGINTAGSQHSQVLYGLLTLAVPLGPGLDHRLWFGFNQGFQPQNNPTPGYLAGGWLAQGLIPGRPLDVLAIACASTRFSQQLSAGLQPEALVELNYTVPLSSQLAVQPVLQWILQPGGDSARAPVFAAGVQLTLSF